MDKLKEVDWRGLYKSATQKVGSLRSAATPPVLYADGQGGSLLPCPT